MKRITLVLGFLFLMASAAQAQNPFLTELLDNPGFESGTFPWTRSSPTYTSYPNTGQQLSGTGAAGFLGGSNGEQYWLQSQSFEMHPGELYQFSVNAKQTGFGPGDWLKVRLHTYDQSGNVQEWLWSEPFVPTNSYQQFTATLPITAPDTVSGLATILYFDASGNSATRVYVDDASLKRVEPAKLFYDIQTSAAVSSVFEPGEPIVISPTIRNPTTQAASVDFQYELSDSHGQVLSSGAAPAQISAGGATTLNIPFDETSLPQQEYLRLRTKLISNGTEFDNDTMGLGILPRRDPLGPAEDSQFGLLVGWHPGYSVQPEDRFKLAQLAGARWDRPGEALTNDRFITAREHDFEPVLLVLTDPSVGSIGPESVINGTATEAEFAAYVTKTVTEHKGLIKYYQFGNEPAPWIAGMPAKIVAAQKVAYEAAKAADPDAIIVAPGICCLEVGPSSWAALLEAGLGNYADVYDHHFYSSISLMDSLLTTINQANVQYNAVKPQFVTETSVDYVNRDWNITEEEKGAHVIKRYAIALSQNIDVPFWFALMWPEGYGADGPDAKATQASLLDPVTGYPLESYFTFAAMTRELEGAEFTRRLNLGNGIYAIEFDHGTYTNLVLWSEVGNRLVNIAAVNGQVGITEVSGRKTYGETVNGQFAITAGDLPVILSFALELPGDFNMDGVVNAADYTVWRDMFGKTGVGLAADGNNDGKIDQGDYDVWRGNFGTIAGEGAAAYSSVDNNVPEPASCSLLGSAVAWSLLLRCRLCCGHLRRFILHRRN